MPREKFALPGAVGVGRLSSMRAAAHAKVNWWLKVHGRRADGFHDIETLMLPLDLHDIVEVRMEGEALRVTCSDPQLPTGAENLAGRAALIFCEAVGMPCTVSISIEKRIPSGAGLGGGSSDAAAVLRALNWLSGAKMSPEALAGLAAQVGSDCPWFIESKPRICRGRGEVLGRVEESGEWQNRRLLLVKPPFGVPTAWAYGELAALRAAGRLSSGNTFSLNDLEPPVFRKYLLLPALQDFLAGQEGVERATMSGSGSTIFAVLREGADVAGLAAALRSEFGETLRVQEAEVAETLAPGGGM